MADFLNPYLNQTNPYTAQQVPMNPQFNQFTDQLRNAYQQALQPMQQFQQQLQNPQQMMQSIQNQVPVPGFVIKTAADVEEVKATPFVNPDGSPDLIRTYLFVNAGKGEIYVSKIGNNGLKDTKTYVAKTGDEPGIIEPQTPQEEKPDLLAIMNERLERIEKALEVNQNGSNGPESDGVSDENGQKRVKPPSNSKSNAKQS